VEEVFLLSEKEKNKTQASNRSDKFFPLYSSGNERGHPRLDLINTQFEKMFFDVDKKVNKIVLNEKILIDDFDKFNEKIQDRIIRDIYDKDFQAIPVKQGENISSLNQNQDYILAKVISRNKKYEKNIDRIFRKMYFYIFK
jgi:hypothetical protein